MIFFFFTRFFSSSVLLLIFVPVQSHRELVPVLDVFMEAWYTLNRTTVHQVQPTRREELTCPEGGFLTLSHPEWMICHRFVSLGQSSHSTLKTECVQSGKTISAISEIGPFQILQLY